MNLEICRQNDAGVEGKKVRCSFNDCLWNEKNKMNCSEQACQTEDFGIGELWDVEKKVLQEYFKVNYRVILLTFIAFWYFFTIFVPYLTTGKLGDLHFSFFATRWNYECEFKKEFIEKCIGAQNLKLVIDEVTGNNPIKMNEKLLNYYFDSESNKSKAEEIRQIFEIQTQIDSLEKEKLGLMRNEYEGKGGLKINNEENFVNDDKYLEIGSKSKLNIVNDLSEIEIRKIGLQTVDGDEVLERGKKLAEGTGLCNDGVGQEEEDDDAERDTEEKIAFYHTYINDKLLDSHKYLDRYFHDLKAYNKSFFFSGFAILQLVLVLL